MRQGCLTLVVIGVMLVFALPIIREAHLVDMPVLARSTMIGLVIGLVFGSAPAYALGWIRRAQKTAEDGHARVEKQLEADKKLI
jgi:L-cystine uptake protein TcyP (sodium:dicarboxylate symporter family)